MTRIPSTAGRADTVPNFMVTCDTAINATVFSVVPTHLFSITFSLLWRLCRLAEQRFKDATKAVACTRFAEDIPPWVCIGTLFGGRCLYRDWQVTKPTPHESSNHALDSPHLDRAINDYCSADRTFLPSPHESPIPCLRTVQ
ncbi:hypothetical protein CVT26_003561 [Gymnopilus dilepis]|uniref:Uncharacterized protein n=1 Tax=Gymnopilus dilepis TaxID=231916 RepID=A0A409VSC3_9AGAR|nr:hypothetical protein CVT26_003561 [Gymnopilus dilepis]